MRKVCVVTGSRAEYGLLYFLLKNISASSSLELQLIVTGMHLSPEFGVTYREIEKDGFRIDKKVTMNLSSDSWTTVAQETGRGVIGMTNALSELQPDILVLLGDRFEIFSAAIAGLFSTSPIAHIHGGEITEGAFDDAIRHSITKISYWHFVAAEEYRKRVIQLGEDPNRVFLVGSLNYDAILNTSLLKKEALERKIDFIFGERNLLITFHPVTLERNTSEEHMKELLSALADFEVTNFLFTAPNADTDGTVIKKLIEEFVSDRKETAKLFVSMGRVNYLSTLQYVDGVVGNSSSGVLEVPYYGIGTVNIGDRQKGRLRCPSIIDCGESQTAIAAAIKESLSRNFQLKASVRTCVYGDGSAAEQIHRHIIEANLEELIQKYFRDISHSSQIF